MKFKCDGCGLCCTKAYLIPELSHLIDENGQCKNFINSKCSIYENRPLVCNVDEYYKFVVSKKVSKRKFYTENYVVCEKLKMENQAA
jgi:Fe-S-cluster containining protein